MTDAAAIGGGRIFCLMSMAVLQCGSSRTTHMYMHQRFTRGIRHEGGRERVLFLVLFLRFRLQFLLRMGAEQLHQTAGTGRRGARHSRPAEKFVLVASDINIFGTLPNCQGKLFVRPTDQAARAIGLFFLVLVWVANRRYCGNDDDDGTSCNNSSSSSERYRSCSVSIQTVVLSKPSSVAKAVLPCPYEWCMSGGMVVCRSVAILPARRLRTLPASMFREHRITAHNRYTPAIDTSAQF